ncbi:hypothetical protein [Sphingomonas sp.]|jgi:hypothetical protein|uniref:hypothetical protein n=1 Tax=Sphingomonas sp. TaxID=28214 RepID=UPI002E356086|nr:hypothetical protein [Sphingomonas sp.]HEX4694640.1 hypothetical protein [Sphingomonas sp.]
MPIVVLWAETMAPHAADVMRWLKNMDRSTFLLDRWLEARVPAAERMEEATAAFPIFNYYNTALTARVADIQFGSLLTVPVDGVGAHVERALEKWDIPGNIANQARSAALPAEMLRVFEEITVALIGSLDRFKTPTTEMFDPKARTASDMIGMTALVWRSLGANRNGFYQALERLRDGLGLPANDNGGAHAPLMGGAQAAAGLPLADQLDEMARYVVAGLLVIPALSSTIEEAGRDALTLAKYKALAKFEHWETLAWNHRKAILGSILNGMAAITETALQLFLRIGSGVTGIVESFAAIGGAYLRGLTSGVADLAEQIRAFWGGVIGLINQVVGFVQSITAVDIGAIIHEALVTIQEVIAWFSEKFYDDDERPPAYTAPAQFTVTIGQAVMKEGPGVTAVDQLGLATKRLSFAVRHAPGLKAALGKFAADAFGGINLDRMVAALASVGGILDQAPDPQRAQPVLKTDFTNAPDLVAKIVRPLRAGLMDAVDQASRGANDAVTDVFASANTRLNDTASAFHKEAQSAAAFDPKKLMARMVGDSDALLNALFGGQSPEARKTGLDAVALAFSAWMQGGFDTVANLSSGYIRFMLDEWTEQIAKNEDLPLEVNAASPKKLLQRAELGRVHMPKLRIVAQGGTIDRALAGRVADTFRDEVEAAYRRGAKRLSDLAQAA